MATHYDVNINGQDVQGVFRSEEELLAAADRARVQHNNDLDTPNDVSDPNFCADVPAYIQWVMQHANASWYVQYPPGG